MPRLEREAVRSAGGFMFYQKPLKDKVPIRWLHRVRSSRLYFFEPGFHLNGVPEDAGEQGNSFRLVWVIIFFFRRDYHPVFLYGEEKPEGCSRQYEAI